MNRGRTDRKQPLLKLEQVEICYRRTPVVHGLTLEVAPGEILGIVGESGSGKSTVIKGIIGLLGNEVAVTEGKIYYKGEELLHGTPEELRNIRGPEMGMVFQNAGASLCPIRKIGDQLYEAVIQHERVSRTEVRRRAMELFEKMKLSEGSRILDSYPFELSGGMNQRVGIMMAMILKPALLLADEPTSALDVTIQAQVVREMMKLRDTFGTSIIIVTHNIGVVEHMADNIAVMCQGKLVEYGTKHEVIHSPRDPYTRKLLGAVLRLNRR